MTSSGMTKIAGPHPVHAPPEIWQTNAPEGYRRFEGTPGFDWRVPVVYDKIKNRHLVGQPGMEHHTMMQHFEEYGGQDPWAVMNRFTPGYVDIEGTVGQPGLHWFNRSKTVPDDNLHDYIEDEHGVRNPGEHPPGLGAEPEEWS